MDSMVARDAAAADRWPRPWADHLENCGLIAVGQKRHQEEPQVDGLCPCREVQLTHSFPTRDGLQPKRTAPCGRSNRTSP